MSVSETIDDLIASRRVVVFHSPVTDLAQLPEALTEAGESPRYVELGMGDAANRERFAELRGHSGRRTLPQVFVDGVCVGGLREALEWAIAGDARPAPGAARALGYGGLLPFAAAALAVWLGLPGAAEGLAAYAAVILSFVGAIHWGIASVRASVPAFALALSVLPALLAWAALLLAPALGLPALFAGFAAWRAAEHAGLLPTLPGWLARLRTHLTAGAMLAILAGWLGIVLP